MKAIFASLSTSTAALVVGIAFITSVIIVTIVDDFLLANFVVPGDTDELVSDIKASGKLFGLAVVGYLLVLILDAVIGLALYVVLKPANRNLAWITAALRLLYAGTVIVGLFFLVFKYIDAYGYESIKLIGYIFFALHVFVLGYSICKTEYIPKYLGVLLVVASFTYIVFFIDFNISEPLKILIMLTMAFAELALSIWLIVKKDQLPG